MLIPRQSMQKKSFITSMGGGDIADPCTRSLQNIDINVNPHFLENSRNFLNQSRSCKTFPSSGNIFLRPSHHPSGFFGVSPARFSWLFETPFRCCGAGRSYVRASWRPFLGLFPQFTGFVGVIYKQQGTGRHVLDMFCLFFSYKNCVVFSVRLEF